MRIALSALVHFGLAYRRQQVDLHVPEGAPSLLGQAVDRGLELHALVTVLGANRRTNIQVFDGEGVPVCFLKTGWNEVTRRAVTTELEALGTVVSHRSEGSDSSGQPRVPRVLSSGEAGTLTYLAVEPLPDGCALLSPQDAPSANELLALMPLARHARVAETDAVKAALNVLGVLRRSKSGSPGDELVEECSKAERALRRHLSSVPVVERWHGDLVPWNAARDADGVLWLWDWESSGSDAPAGMDALHWHLRAVAEGSDLAGQARHTARASVTLLAPYGVDRLAAPYVFLAYSLLLCERVWTYADLTDGWETALFRPADLAALLSEAVAATT